MSLFAAGSFAKFNNCQISIVSDGGTTRNERGVPIAGQPVEVLPAQGAQEWELDAKDTAGFTGEQIQLMKKVRLDAYHANLTAKMTAILDGVKHNIINAGHDGSKSYSILLLRRVTQ